MADLLLEDWDCDEVYEGSDLAANDDIGNGDTIDSFQKRLRLSVFRYLDTLDIHSGKESLELVLENTANLYLELRKAVDYSIECLPRQQRILLREELLNIISDDKADSSILLREEFQERNIREIELQEYEEHQEPDFQEAGSEDTRGSVQAAVVKQPESRGRKNEPRLITKRIIKRLAHSTISRDQTAASNYKKELLVVLRSHQEEKRQGGTEHRDIEPRQPVDKIVMADTKGQDRTDVLRSSFAPGLTHRIQHPLIGAVSNRVSPGERGTPQTPVDTALVQGQAQSSEREHKFSDIVNLSPAEDSAKGALSIGDNDQQALKDRIAALERENSTLKQSKTPASHQTFYMIRNDEGKYSTYLDEPSWTVDQNKTASLRARMMVHDPNAFLQNKQNVAFCIGKIYTPQAQVREVQQASQTGRPLPEPVPTAEDIVLMSNDMIEAFAEFANKMPDFEKNFPSHVPRDRMLAPYMF